LQLPYHEFITPKSGTEPDLFFIVKITHRSVGFGWLWSGDCRKINYGGFEAMI
jgi:hypothetical protein